MSNNINQNDMLRIGTVLHGVYRIDRYLSSGGFGNTYVATDTSRFDERYAIKEFFMSGITERDADSSTVSVSNANNKATFKSQIEKFKKEALRLHNISNAHIVHVYALFEENETAYYVMDYIDGESMSERLKRTAKPMKEDEVMKLLPQILDALEVAHKAGIMHLDIKPANIMVDKEGVMKLIDFGASKQQRLDGNGATTNTTTIAYTPGYAPIEQIAQSLEEFGPWTDFYALGATLYTLLTNRKPPSPTKISRDESQDKSVTLPMAATISQKMRRLVLWLMDYDAKKRPQSVETIRNFMADNNDDTTIIGKDPEEERTLLDSNKATEGTENVSVGEDGTSETEETTEQPKEPKKHNLRWIIAIAVAAIVAIPIIVLLTRNNGNTNQPTIGTADVNKEIIENLIGNMVPVEGGTFTMGATSEQGSDAYDDEKPTHQVTLSGFSIGKYEVTQKEWQAVMGSNPSYFKGDNRPVEQVSWDDCQTFIRKLNQMTGRNFRLPTEAEWEYAARGGNSSRGYKYAGSNNLGDVAWYDGNSGNFTHDVGTKQPNELGLCDMSGNVWEWCSDWYGSYSSSAQTNPHGATSSSSRVLRGGSWDNIAGDCRVSCRGDYTPGRRSDNLGLRLVL